MNRASFVAIALQFADAFGERTQTRGKIEVVRFYQVPDDLYRKVVTSQELRAHASLEIVLRNNYLAAGIRILELSIEESQRLETEGNEGNVSYRWGLVGFDKSESEVISAFFGSAYLAVNPSIDSKSTREKKIMGELRDLVDSLLRHDGLLLEDRQRLFGCG
jgi:hypothetical protein